ncbi:MAG: hypothetical protein EOO75_00320 [Myxococcales bacterium]|nr:MAG: hypothetical protein EOO75_00320 [Myxococcales bacterium]
MTPGVAHVPWSDQFDWNWHVGARYIRQLLLTATPAAALWALRSRGLKPVSDARFAEILTDGIISKFVVPLEPIDEALFAPQLAASSWPAWCKSDFRPMELIGNPIEGETTPTVVLWQDTGDHRFVAHAIAVGAEVFTPGDGARWEAAKYFALQGAGVLTTILMHPLLHFPSDTVNAITRTRLHETHLLRRLLRPHLRLSLEVNEVVLHGTATVLRPGFLYSPYPGKLPEHRRVVSVLWQGYPAGAPSAAYPAYRFPMSKPVVRSGYGEFLGRYWDVIYDFVTQVVTQIDTDDSDVRWWAHHISRWLPDFPDETQIFVGDNLARAVTSVIHTVSVAHTADHWIYHYDVDPREVPFRLRMAVPGSSSDYPAPDPARLVTRWDNLNYRMCSDLFFKPFTVAGLASVDYGFEPTALQQLNVDFRAALAGVERTMKQEGRKIYIALDDIATSVQF